MRNDVEPGVVVRRTMNKTMRIATATAGLLAVFALPLVAQAATTTSAPAQHFNLQTRMFDRYHAGEYDGQLVLTIYPNGIVQGTYRPSDGGVRTVTGGVDGENIWLDIGQSRPLHWTGTFIKGVLDMVAAIPGPDTYSLQSVGSVTTGK
jgi:hypothetical protein